MKPLLLLLPSLAPADILDASLNVNSIASMFQVGPGTTLAFSNIRLRGFALPAAYQYTPGAPYRLLGSSFGLWPTVGLAPNATVSGLGSSC
jgi:hypothetical protein